MPRADPPAAPHGSWVSYASREAVVLAIVLAAVAGIFAYLGTRVRSPISVTRPGRTVSGFLIALWLLAIYTFLVAYYVTGVQLRQVHLVVRAPNVRVGTPIYAALSFVVIPYLTRRHGWTVALVSAFIGTAAGWNIFELPFDLIVMPMTYPAIPPSPALYRQLFFLPLFMIELSTIALLTLLPSMRITGYALYALARMFAVFAVWAMFGFGFPDETLPRTLNIVSKVCVLSPRLCFLSGRRTG